MTVSIRRGSSSDRDAILALRREVFAGEDREKQSAAFWEWEFQSDIGRAAIFVAELNGRIVGHLGFVPQRYLIGSRLVPALLAVDAMIAPDYRRQALFSRLAARAADELRSEMPLLVAYQIRKAVRPAMLAAGWKHTAAMPLFLAPTSLFLALRQYARKRDAEIESVSHSSSALRTFNPTDVIAAPGWVTGRCALELSSDFVDWRFERNPAWSYQCVTGEDGQAFAVYRDTLLRGMPTRCMIELGFRPGCEAQLISVIRLLRRDAARAGVGLIAALLSIGHPAVAALRKAGLVRGPHTFNFLAQTTDSAVQREIESPDSWSLTWSSTDHV